MSRYKHCGGVVVNSQSDNCGDYFKIKKYLSNCEMDLVGEELDESTNPYFNGFVKPSRSSYAHRGGSKSGNTELRVAGVILNMIRASLKHAGGCKIKFTKSDIARQIQTDGKPVSERTVQRWLQVVLDKLSKIYKIHHDIKHGAKGGIIVWTDSFDQTIKTTGDLFDASLLPKIKRDKDLTKIKHWQQRETKHALRIKKAKAKSYNKAGIPPAMMKLAFKLINQSMLDHYPRLNPSPTLLKVILAKLLAKGYWRTDAINILQKSLYYTDSAMVDFKISNPFAYLRGVITNMSKTIKPDIDKVKNTVNEFWIKQLYDYKVTVNNSIYELDSDTHKLTLSYLATKIVDRNESLL